MNPNQFSETESLVLLNRLIPGGGKSVRAMLEQGEAAGSIIERIFHENLFQRQDELRELLKEFSPQREIENAYQSGIRVIAWGDCEYPEQLRNIYDPPILLYIKGSLQALDRAAVSIVGSRAAGFYGLEQARILACRLSERGITIVSGLARGIDRAAHEGALQCIHGRTVAVLGCGADVIYPRENHRLFKQIEERGAILSEYPLGSEPRRQHFPRRNRIISGMSLGTLVVQAGERSGSLITARLALEEGREVYALPGPVNDPLSTGALGLVKEGATLVTSVEDIYETLVPSLKEIAASMPETKEQEKIYYPPEREPMLWTENEQEKSLLEVLEEMPLTMDEISEKLNLPPSFVSGPLLQLQLRKAIFKTPDGRYCLPE